MKNHSEEYGKTRETLSPKRRGEIIFDKTQINERRFL
jgi:hypothetical protein